MRKTESVISIETAIESASTYAGIVPATIHDVTVQNSEDSLYYVVFRGDWMLYQCYVDKGSGEVRGFFSEPIEL